MGDDDRESRMRDEDKNHGDKKGARTKGQQRIPIFVKAALSIEGWEESLITNSHKAVA